MEDYKKTLHYAVKTPFNMQFMEKLLELYITIDEKDALYLEIDKPMYKKVILLILKLNNGVI